MNHQNNTEISFFVPCYNESGNIVGTIELIQRMMAGRNYGYEIFVVDDASTDDSWTKLEQYKQNHPDVPLSIHRNPANKGLGYNYLHFAAQAKGDYYMLINGDNDIPVEDLGMVLDQKGKADVVVPYIINQTDRPPMRCGLSFIFTHLINLISGNRLKYYNGPVLHRRQNILRFRPPTSGFAYQAELLCRTLYSGATYVEVPFHSLKRHYGRSSAFRLKNIIAVNLSILRIMKLRIQTLFQKGL